MISLTALLLTAGWVVLVILILALFGGTAGGAWSIAGGLARGLREWAGAHGPDTGRAPGPPEDASPGPLAETEDLGTRPMG